MMKGVNGAVVQVRLFRPTSRHHAMGIGLLFHFQRFYADPSESGRIRPVTHDESHHAFTGGSESDHDRCVVLC